MTMFRIMYWLSVAVEQINILIDKKIVYSFTYDFAALPGLIWIALPVPYCVIRARECSSKIVYSCG